MPLAERVRRLRVGIDAPLAFFSADGELMHATPAGEARLLGLKSLAALGADPLAGEALVAGRAAGASHLGPIALERIGSDASTVLLATFPQAAAEHQAAAPAPAAPRQAARAGSRPSRQRHAAAAAPPPPIAAAPPPRRRQAPPPSAASRCASSGRWMPTAASPSAPRIRRR